MIWRERTGLVLVVALAFGCEFKLRTDNKPAVSRDKSAERRLDVVTDPNVFTVGPITETRINLVCPCECKAPESNE